MQLLPELEVDELQRLLSPGVPFPTLAPHVLAAISHSLLFGETTGAGDIMIGTDEFPDIVDTDPLVRTRIS